MNGRLYSSMWMAIGMRDKCTIHRERFCQNKHGKLILWTGVWLFRGFFNDVKYYIRIHDTCHKFKSCLWYSSSLYKQSFNQNGITNNSFSRYELNGNQFDFKFKFMWTILAMLPNLVLSTFYKKLSLSILFYYCKGVLHLIPEGS